MRNKYMPRDPDHYHPRPLGDRPILLLKFIRDFNLKHEYCPSYMEMAVAIANPGREHTSTSVIEHFLSRLYTDGYVDGLITAPNGRLAARTIHLTTAGKRFLESRQTSQRRPSVSRASRRRASLPAAA